MKSDICAKRKGVEKVVCDEERKGDKKCVLFLNIFGVLICY